MSKKFSLGKGLEALIPDQNNDDNSSNLLVPLNKIKSNSEQPRKAFDNEKIIELSESIKQHGILQPLIVKKDGTGYIIVAGERRWRAAKLAGLKEIPVMIMDLTDKQVLEISLIENIQRQDLNPIEEAVAYKKLITDFNITQEELSKRLGKSRTAITNIMRLLNLDTRVQQYLIENVLSEGHGRTLLSISNGDLQYEIAQKAIDESMSVRELERCVKNILNSEQNQHVKKEKQLNQYYKDVKERLQTHFGTKVNLNNNKNKGKIEIEYYSEDDLQRILEILNL